MQWRAAQLSDVRVKKKFLFFPKTINCTTKWLMVAKWKERYMIGDVLDHWKGIEWL